jgi:hypothetical protein
MEAIINEVFDSMTNLKDKLSASVAPSQSQALSRLLSPAERFQLSQELLRVGRMKKRLSQSKAAPATHSQRHPAQALVFLAASGPIDPAQGKRHAP